MPQQPQANIGDFVTAKLAGLDDCCQGVYTKNNGDGSILVEGELETYICEGPANVTVVPEKNLPPHIFPKTAEHIQAVRERLKNNPT